MSRHDKSTYETEKEYLPSRLRELMWERNVTQEQLGEAIGVRRQTISLYMTGQSKPDWTQVAKIARFFRISSDYLLGLTETTAIDMEKKAMCEYTGLSEVALDSLNFLKSDLGDPNFRRSVLLDVFEDILCNPGHYRVDQHIWRAALAGIEFMRYSGETLSNGLSDSKYDVKMLLAHIENMKNKNTEGLFTIPANEALLWYSNRAVDELSQVFTKAIQSEINNAIRDMLGDDVECLSNKRGKDHNNATENDT